MVQYLVTYSAMRIALLFLILSTQATILSASPQLPQGQLLQTSVAGHVLGFHTHGLYVAGSDRLLHVAFQGANPTLPQPVFALDHQLSEVVYPRLWPAVSLSYATRPNGIIESTWEIAAGGHPGQIRLRYNRAVEIAADGSLRIPYASGWMSESAPVAWQVIAGLRHPVEIAFQLIETGENASIVGFQAGSYDPEHPLLIDPVLAWHTFLGSASSDSGNAIAVDAGGYVYVAGNSSATWGSPEVPHAGGQDAFVARLSPNGVRQWHTFLGSSAIDRGFGITVDNNGYVYVAGQSVDPWGTPVNAHTGFVDAFVAKLDAVDGGREWHTFMGSLDQESAEAVTVDSSGNVYATGYSGNDWGVGSGAPVNGHAGDYDAFVTKLNSSGARQWHTYLGSADEDRGRGVAVDDDGNVFLTGTSETAWGSPERAYSGGDDAFAAKLNNSGALQWHTFLGSATDDQGNAITVDSSGNVFLVGTSDAAWGLPVSDYAGNDDAFAAKLNASGELQWHTFMGAVGNLSIGFDSGNALSLDGGGNLYVVGRSDATWGTPENAFAGDVDAFVAMLGGDGVRQWHSFQGSAGEETGFAVALDADTQIVLAGTGDSSWSGGAPREPYAGGGDAFVAKLGGCKFYIIKLKNNTVLPLCL